MNEKIKELLPNPFAVDYIGTDEPIDLYTEKEMFEFAEIIIKECIDVINNNIKYNQLILLNDTSYKIHNMASLTGVIGKIKNHFGVE